MERECGVWINIVSHKLKRQLNNRLSKLGITGVQGPMIHYILKRAQEGPVFQRDLERAFELNRSTVTGIVQLLERNELLVRESVADDARLKRIVPTEKMVQLDGRLRECQGEAEEALTRGFTPGQRQMFLELIEKMSANLDDWPSGKTDEESEK